MPHFWNSNSEIIMQRYKIWWVPFKAQRFPSLPRLKSRYLDLERIFLTSSEKNFWNDLIS